VPVFRPLEIRRLGVTSYIDALELQKRMVEQRRAGEIEDVLLLVEHPPVLTLGVRGDGGRSHIVASEAELSARHIDVFETGRGGDITYHGPGQIVGYPIIDLNPDRRDVHKYVRDIEEVLIRVAADYGITAERIPGLTGVTDPTREVNRPKPAPAPAPEPAPEPTATPVAPPAPAPAPAPAPTAVTDSATGGPP